MQSAEARLVAALAAHGWRLATAESLTGGMLAARITRIPGASRVLAGGVVAYTNDAKARLLGAPRGVLEKEGAVSEAAARAMAEAARRALDADLAVALTGVAGPDALEGHAPGLVILGLATRDRTWTRTARYEGSRAGIRQQAVDEALRMLLEAVPKP